MAQAQMNYENLLTRQSQTLQDAVRTYRKRYKRNPPKGFEEWYAFAKDNDVKIIDEYDQLMEDLHPFFNLSGNEMRRRALQVGSLPSVDLVKIQNGTSEIVEMKKAFQDDESKIPGRIGGPRARGFRAMISKFEHKLPDMYFPINAKAEGRVLVPWEHKAYPNMTLQDSSAGVQAMLGEEFHPDWRGEGNVWEAYRRTCHPSSKARRLFGSIRGQTALSTSHQTSHLSVGQAYIKPLQPEKEITFVEGPDDTFDFCAEPWARFQQGHFFSDWRTIPVFYPILSPGKAPGFSDILIPSHYYYSPTRDYTYGWNEGDPKKPDEVDQNEVPWEEKSEKIFWRGSTTGGGSSPPGFITSYQRHRFLETATGQSSSNATRLIVFADPPGSEHFISAEIPLHDMNEELMDTAFTKAVGCKGFPGGCDGMSKHYRFANPVPLGEHWRHKYLIDFDGMGYSARAMAFLESESALVKATVYREFYSDWIQPWLHYIPLSQSYQEIYNIHAYFSGASPSMLKAVHSESVPLSSTERLSSDGDKQLRKIASSGREWKQSVGRKVDMEKLGHLKQGWTCWIADTQITKIHQWVSSTSSSSSSPRSIAMSATGVSFMSAKTGLLPSRLGPYAEIDRTDDEFDRAIGRFLSVKDQNFAISGTIPMESESTILFFKTSVTDLTQFVEQTGITHSLPFPLRTDRFNQSPAFNALLAECENSSDELDLNNELEVHKDSSVRARLDNKSKPRTWSLRHPFSLSFDLANHPIIDTIRSVLFPKLHPGSYLYAVRDKLELFLAGTSSNASRSPPSQGYSGATRVGTIILTLPMLYGGGASLVRNQHGRVERFYSPAQGNPGDTTLHWMAYTADCDHEVDLVEHGCRLIISYRVYMKSFGPAGPSPNPLLIPNNQLLDALMLVLNLSRRKTLAIHLTGQYTCAPTQLLADSLVPFLKGSDATLYHSLKLFRLTPELRWSAAGYIWPADKTVKFDRTEELLPATVHQNTNIVYNLPGAAAQHIRQRRKSTSRSVGSFDSESMGSSSSGSFESSYLSRSRSVRYEGQSRWETGIGNGALSLADANIILLTSPQDVNVFVEEVDVNLRGELFKVPSDYLDMFAFCV
ncbi:hypothetical protein Clacol_008974 [Clathrus columnatus]|uniref:Glycosyl transferase CAP10 domain-containing protein n=1 Tax=Clathrus columnatus TaxID=1419009 RepID=A0AAV5ALR8_9AGAM|nr:hypothetical protein Clacol_008974 [Clathrus columnatus]